MRKILAILTIFSCGFISGEIHEIKNIREVFDFVKPEMLVLFDIDNTLMVTSHHIGGDAWFQHHIRKLRQEGHDWKEAWPKLLHRYHALQHLATMKLVENEILPTLKQLQEDHLVLAATHRSPCLMYCTTQQLTGLGVFLKESAPRQESCHISMDPSWIVYHEGVVFTSGSPKGKALLAYFDEISYKPSSILAIDDRKQLLEEIEACCNENGIAFIGLRYGHLDEKVSLFDHEIASLQYAQIFQEISDEKTKASSQ